MYTEFSLRREMTMSHSLLNYGGGPQLSPLPSGSLPQRLEDTSA